MELRQMVEEEIDHLNPRLEELAEGDVEVIYVDEKTGTVTLRIIGGRLHWCEHNALSLWAEKLLKEAVPEVREVNTVEYAEETHPKA